MDNVAHNTRKAQAAEEADAAAKALATAKDAFDAADAQLRTTGSDADWDAKDSAKTVWLAAEKVSWMADKRHETAKAEAGEVEDLISTMTAQGV